VALGTSYLRLALAAALSGDAPPSGVLGILTRVQLATPNAAFLNPEEKIYVIYRYQKPIS
jgi:hypothetical protein